MLSKQLKDIARRLRPIFEQLLVQRAIVFGSLARGEATRRSDLDLIVVMDTDKRFLDRYDDLLLPVARNSRTRCGFVDLHTPGAGADRPSPFHRDGIA